MIQFEECKRDGYPARTKENIFKSDITLALATDFNTRGEQLTANICKDMRRLYIPINLNDNGSYIMGAILDKIITENYNRTPTINIAGNGIYILKEGQEYYNMLLMHILDGMYKTLKSLKCLDTIKLVRSGGQTGIDQAGVIAADRLELNTLVLAPKGWLFRNKSGKDIANEEQFKARFI